MKQTYIRAPSWAIHGFRYRLQSGMGCKGDELWSFARHRPHSDETIHWALAAWTPQSFQGLLYGKFIESKIKEAYDARADSHMESSEKEEAPWQT